jgi:uncharacterized membrane protein YadS
MMNQRNAGKCCKLFGVSAAIATAGAIKGDSKKLSYVILLVLVVAIPMMIFIPLLAKWINQPDEVKGALM